MKDKVFETPDYIFETSWEVCNKVGGIYTTIATKAQILSEDSRTTTSLSDLMSGRKPIKIRNFRRINFSINHGGRWLKLKDCA